MQALHMCPMGILVGKDWKPHTPIYVSSCTYICVLILLYVCPHAPIYVSSYSYMCPHTPIYVSSYSYICVLKLIDSIARLRECRPRRDAAYLLLLYYFTTTIKVSSYPYYCVYAAEAGQSRRNTRTATAASSCQRRSRPQRRVHTLVA